LEKSPLSTFIEALGLGKIPTLHLYRGSGTWKNSKLSSSIEA